MLYEPVHSDDGGCMVVGQPLDNFLSVEVIHILFLLPCLHCMRVVPLANIEHWVNQRFIR